jgi:hypothetical protein
VYVNHTAKQSGDAILLGKSDIGADPPRPKKTSYRRDRTVPRKRIEEVNSILADGKLLIALLQSNPTVN